MRTFRHLSQAEISEIVTLHADGATQAKLAEMYEVDRSTISYHINKFDRAYPEQGGVYAVIKARVRKTCVHPSSRCTFCGQMADMLLRQERKQIASLEKRLADAHSRLRVAGLPVE